MTKEVESKPWHMRKEPQNTTGNHKTRKNPIHDTDCSVGEDCFNHGSTFWAQAQLNPEQNIGSHNWTKQ